MNAILFCQHNCDALPVHHLPEGLLSYCNQPLIAHILQFLAHNGISDITLVDADARLLAAVDALHIPVQLTTPEELPPCTAPTLVLYRLSLPRWDMGELHSLALHAPVRLCHADGSSTDAVLLGTGDAVKVPEREILAVHCDFHRAATPAQYLAQQREFLRHPEHAARRIGAAVCIGKNAEIDAQTIIGNDCVIGDHAVLTDCVLMDGVQVGAGAVLRGSILCRHARVDRGTVLQDVVQEEGTTAAEHHKTPVHRNFVVDAQDGIHCGLPRWNSPDTALLAGAAMTVLGKRIAIGYGAPEGENFAVLAAGGAVSQGAQVWQVGHCTRSALLHAARLTECDAVLWITGDAVQQMHPLTFLGTAPESAQLRRIQQAMEARISGRILPAGSCIPAQSLTALWEGKVRGIFHRPECVVEICCGNSLLRRTAQALFGAGKGERLVLNLSDDGAQVSVFSQDSGMIRHEQLLLLSLLSFLPRHEGLALPAHFHPAAEDFAQRMGGRILRMFTPQVSPTAAQLFAKQGVCADGVLLFAHILHIMEERGMRLSQLAALLPPMYTMRREISTTLTAQAVEIIRRSNPDRNIRMSLPDHRGMVQLLAYTDRAETAAELCAFWENRLHHGA